MDPRIRAREITSRLVRATEPLARALTPGRLLLAAGAAVLLALGAWQRCGVVGCPDVRRLASYQPGGAPVVLDRHGDSIAALSPRSHDVVRLADLPAHVPAAFIAIEDHRFHDHRGVDWRRVFGAALANVRAGRVAEGSSTITMQLARNVFPERLPGEERTLRRKLLEVRVARDIEQAFSKDEILELYLNHIYFGDGAYGIEAAARNYFGKGAAGLELAEAALLAALPKAPAHYDPRRRPERARERRDLVLSLMREQEAVDSKVADEAADTPIRVGRERRPIGDGPAPAAYFVERVRRLLEDRLGEELYSSKLRIRTTLDPAAQRAAEEALEAQLRRMGGGDPPIEGAFVILDAHTGDVRAHVGGRDFRRSAFDRAALGRRPVGSAYKPFVYAAALEDGFTPGQPLVDEPLRIDLDGGEVWEPRNYDGRFEGRVSLREALVRSRNVPTVRLARAVGLDDVADEARRAGLRGEIPDGPASALGTASASPLELASAYTSLAALGPGVEPRYVLGVETPEGKALWEPEVRRRDGLRPAVAYVITDMLRDVVDHGTARAVRSAGVRGPVAGKTGTTQEAADAWFAGYTPELVGVVWIGHDRPRPIGPEASAASIAVPVWAAAVRRLHDGGRVPGDWTMPEGVVERRIDPETGLLLAAGCAPASGEPVDELFLEDDQPAETCPAGERESRGWLATVGERIGAALGSLFGRGRDREARAREAGEVEELLGARRLPRRGDRVGGDSDTGSDLESDRRGRGRGKARGRGRDSDSDGAKAGGRGKGKGKGKGQGQGKSRGRGKW